MKVNIIDLDDYKDFIEQHQIDVTTNKSKIPGIEFSSNFNHNFKEAYNENFNFTLFHNMSEFTYRLAGCKRSPNQIYPYSYTIFSKFNLHVKKIESEKLLSIEEIKNIFDIGIDDCMGIPIETYLSYFSAKHITSLHFKEEYTYSDNTKIKYSKIKHGSNSIYVFKSNVKHKTHDDVIYDRFFFQINYNGYWIRIFNRSNAYVYNYNGDFMPPSNMNVYKKLEQFKFDDIKKLFDKKSFKEIMSKVETEVIFS